jgi:hypothetical protein
VSAIAHLMMHQCFPAKLNWMSSMRVGNTTRSTPLEATMPATLPAPETLAETPTFRPFTRSDWDAFAGAETFTDGAEPIAAEGQFTLGAKRRWFLVLDATGGCVLVEDDPQSEAGGYCLDHAFASPAEAQTWFAKQVRNPAHVLEFLMAGFARA